MYCSCCSVTCKVGPPLGTALEERLRQSQWPLNPALHWADPKFRVYNLLSRVQGAESSCFSVTCTDERTTYVQRLLPKATTTRATSRAQKGEPFLKNLRTEENERQEQLMQIAWQGIGGDGCCSQELLQQDGEGMLIGLCTSS